jgi:transglutaminase-like putative cysteine protease
MNDAGRNEELMPYLAPSPGVECEDGGIRTLADELTRGKLSSREKAAALFLFARDQVRYVPYAPFESVEDYLGPMVLERGYGFCTQKTSLLVGLCRAAGIPARFRFADLVNHNMPGRLEWVMQSNRMIFHTYAELFVEGRWLKATPSFERSLCEKMGWRLVEFDGTTDAVLPATDLSGRPHIGYVLDRGTDAGIPLQSMLDAWLEGYGEEAMGRWRAARSAFLAGREPGNGTPGNGAASRS